MIVIFLLRAILAARNLSFLAFHERTMRRLRQLCLKDSSIKTACENVCAKKLYKNL